MSEGSWVWVVVTGDGPAGRCFIEYDWEDEAREAADATGATAMEIWVPRDPAQPIPAAKLDALMDRAPSPTEGSDR